MSRIVTSLALVGLAALAAPAACAHRSPAESAGSDIRMDEASAVIVQVVSHNPHAVELYLEAGPGRQRLGVLGANGRRAIEVQWHSLAGSKRVRLTARQVGSGREVSSGSMPVAPGGKVVWTLEPNLAFSSASVD